MNPTDKEMMDWMEAHRLTVLVQPVYMGWRVTLSVGERESTFVDPTLRLAVASAMQAYPQPERQPGSYSSADRNVPPPCPECGRTKAKSFADAASGGCPKWWATRNPEAEADCRRFAVVFADRKPLASGPSIDPLAWSGIPAAAGAAPGGVEDDPYDSLTPADKQADPTES